MPIVQLQKSETFEDMIYWVSELRSISWPIISIMQNMRINYQNWQTWESKLPNIDIDVDIVADYINHAKYVDQLSELTNMRV